VDKFLAKQTGLIFKNIVLSEIYKKFIGEENSTVG